VHPRPPWDTVPLLHALSRGPTLRWSLPLSLDTARLLPPYRRQGPGRAARTPLFPTPHRNTGKPLRQVGRPCPSRNRKETQDLSRGYPGMQESNWGHPKLGPSQTGAIPIRPQVAGRSALKTPPGMGEEKGVCSRLQASTSALMSQVVTWALPQLAQAATMTSPWDVNEVTSPAAHRPGWGQEEGDTSGSVRTG
jgi:hypothetical protein